MKLIFIVWGLVSKNRLLINLIKKIIAPLWTYKYRKDREKQIHQYLKSNNLPRQEKASSQVAQVAILTNEVTKKRAHRGASDFFNHLGVRFQLITRLGDEQFLTSEYLVVDLTAADNSQFVFKREKHFSVLSGPFENLTVEKLGLRSNCCANLLSALTHKLHFPLITTLPHPLIGFRIDDVTPSFAMFSFLEAANAKNIPINLGLFLDAFREDNLNSKMFFEKFNNDNFEFSPHAFNELRSMFFNLRQNMAYSNDEIRKNFEQVSNFFSNWQIKISPVINAHFHTADVNALDAIRALGGRYFISEINPSSQKIIFDRHFLPQGDPVNCTGAQQFSIFQLYSGDSSRDHLNKTNSYDFLDNSNGNKDVIFLRSVKRLELSLSSGFPAFLTSHGYEIDKHETVLNKMCFFDTIYHWKETNFPDAKFAKLTDICSAYEARIGTSITIEQKANKREKFVDFSVRKKGLKTSDITCIGMMKTLRFSPKSNKPLRLKYGQKKIQII